MTITNKLLIRELESRNIKVEILDPKKSVFRAYVDGVDRPPLLFKNAVTKHTSALGLVIAEDKNLSNDFALQAGLAVPASSVVTDAEKAKDFLKQYRTVVVKPADQSHGHGVTVGITEENQLERAIQFAKTYSDNIVVQQHVDGADTRILFIDGEFIAAMIRKPAYIVGDGSHTVLELIDLENDKDNRQDGYHAKYCSIPIDEAKEYLGGDQLTYIPSNGEEVRVIGPANIGKGGVAIDITETIHSSLVAEAQKLNDTCRLSVSGVDMIVEDPLSRVDKDNQAYFIEVNAVPSFGLHHEPHEGDSVNVAEAYIDWLLND